MNPRSAIVLALAAPSLLTLPAAPSAAQGTLEEVVVTAQRRAQNLQDVPIAISAFGEEALQNLGVNNLQELTEFVSGVELFDDRGSGQPTWVIRGVGLADFNSNNTPTAAIYYDDYYLQSNVLGGIGLFDVSGVEILKGPQGGLYGRNASGGAVKVSSRRASAGEEFNGYITGSYGSWDQAIVEAAIGGAINDSSAFRLSATTDQGGGWQNSLATPGDDDHGDRDFTAVRAQLQFELSDNIDVWIKAEGGTDKTESTLSFARAVYDPNTGDFCASALAGSHNESECVVWSNITNAFGLTPGDPGILPSAQDRDGTDVLTQPINQLDNSWAGLNVQLNWDLEFATFTSITGYLDYENKQVYDFDGQPLTLLHEDGEADLTSWSQELRLVSNGEGAAQWLMGFTYAEDEDDESRVADLVDNIFIFDGLSFREYTQETESWAVYGQLDYGLTDTLNLSGSLRYTDETKNLKDAFHEDLRFDFFYFEDVNKSTELDDNWSGHIGLDWTPTDDAMVYGRITRGFKSGGFFGGFAFTPEELVPYGEETVTSYEVGFKSAVLDRTLQLNGALYYYDYEEVQGFTEVLSPITGTPLTKLDNIGDAEHTGAELDLLWRPASVEGLSFSLGLAWIDAEIADSDTIGLDPAGRPFPVEGLKRGFAPEWSASSQLRYEWSLAGLLAAAQLDYSWRDDLLNEESLGTDLSVATVDIESYSVLNARISLGAQDQGWNIALIGKNLTDEEYWAAASTDDVGSFVSTPNRPMSWMIEGTFRW